MKTYDIQRLKDSYEKMKAGEFESASIEFCDELAKVPQSHYNNIFFPGKAGEEQVIAMDFILHDGTLYFNVKPISSDGGKKTVKFDQFPAFSTEVARNIIAAIEVAEINRKDQKKRERQFNRIRKELDKAQQRKNSKQ